MAEVLLNIIPTFIAFVFSNITGKTIAVYAGQIIMVLALFETACCSVMYSKIFLLKTPVGSQKPIFVESYIHRSKQSTF
uniref:Uncharacterized protein n=1 Tax=Ditylenchus dipsaci TaxID=166011 RepID=A0A915E2X8_9BILA